MPEFSFSDLATWTGGRWTRQPEGPLHAIVHDSRSLSFGCLFIAIQGERYDAHDFIDDVYAAGARAALVAESFVPNLPPSFPCLVVEDTKDALSRIAAGYRRSLDTIMIGITGSAGKTTVKDLLAAMLRGHAPTAATQGNWNNDIGLPLSLCSMPASSRFGVFEVAMNKPGEIARLRDILQPDHGILTNVGAGHLEAFDSVEAIAREKASLFARFPTTSWGVLWRDEPWAHVVQEIADCRWITVGDGGVADYTFESNPGIAPGLVVLECATGDCCQISLNVPGSFYRRDVVLAVAAARQCGVGWSAIQQAAEAFVSCTMRWSVRHMKGIALVNDAYNANPLSMRAALQAFGEMSVAGGRWLVLGGMRELGVTEEQRHREVGHDLADQPWSGLLTLGVRGRWIAEGALDAGMSDHRVICVDDLDVVVNELMERVVPGDAVLFKASRGEALERVVDAFSARLNPESSARPTNHL